MCARRREEERGKRESRGHPKGCEKNKRQKNKKHTAGRRRPSSQPGRSPASGTRCFFFPFFFSQTEEMKKRKREVRVEKSEREKANKNKLKLASSRRAARTRRATRRLPRPGVRAPFRASRGGRRPCRRWPCCASRGAPLLSERRRLPPRSRSGRRRRSTRASARARASRGRPGSPRRPFCSRNRCTPLERASLPRQSCPSRRARSRRGAFLARRGGSTASCCKPSEGPQRLKNRCC